MGGGAEPPLTLLGRFQQLGPGEASELDGIQRKLQGRRAGGKDNATTQCKAPLSRSVSRIGNVDE